MEKATAPSKEVWTGEAIQGMLDSEVKYKDWRFIISERHLLAEALTDAPLCDPEVDLRLRAEWIGTDTITGKPEKQQSRWWPLSKFMVKTEIIQTAFLCVLKAEEHEIREAFQYKGKAPFHTHIDIDTLAGISEDVDVRTDDRPNAPAKQRRE